ncbi:MAG TPA: carboxypeptidase regulatory-like domain-containing protein [Gemmatimonadaceae bacterium]
MSRIALLALVLAGFIAGPAGAHAQAAPPVAAQDTTNRLGSLLGTVFDSVRNAPLVGATVFLLGTPRIGLTNERGLFTVDSVPPGKHKVHVAHELLDSLGISMVTDSFEVAPGERKVLELGVPSGETLVVLSCAPATRRLGPSAIIGRLLDADTDQPVAGARVSFAWSELSLAAGLKRVPKVLGATANQDGVFRICGVPSEVEGTLQAERGGITTAEIKVTFIGQPLVIQGLRIGNANTVAKADVDTSQVSAPGRAVGEQRFSAVNYQKGQAILRGKVVNANGVPIANARVEVEGTNARALTNAEGAFSLAELPSGTQSVVARQLGFAPVSQAVDLSTREVANTVITMSQPVQMLDPVVVRAESDMGLENIGFVERRRGMSGTFMDAEEIMKRGPNMLTDVFRTVPSLRVVPVSPYDYAVESARGNMLGGSCVKYWLDGTPYDPVFPGDVDRMIPPYNIAAIEVYQGSTVPIQFTSANASNCAVIVIWSKYYASRPTRKR